MSRNDRWSTPYEIIATLGETDSPQQKAGPILYQYKGRMYSADEGHINVTGMTGCGKTEGVVLNYVRNVLEHGESLLCIDPKGDIYQRTGRVASRERTYVLDFRQPWRSADRWNPLSYPHRLFCSYDPEETDIACTMVNELYTSIFPTPPNEDPFWTDSSRTLLAGLTYSLFMKAEENEINLSSVAAMLEQADINLSGLHSNNSGRAVTILQESLPKGSLARRCLSGYVSAPNETRGSIKSVAENGLSAYSRSNGLLRMLGEDTVDFQSIDLSKPFAIFLILPDETDVYSPVCGAFISQLSQYLIRRAGEMGGRLPVRLNIVLEELGSIGRTISQLPNLAVASRSRNIRLMMVLQNSTQLTTLYGESQASTISSSTRVSINFSSDNLRSMSALAERCGTTEFTDENGRLVQQPLITGAQLAAMEPFTALILSGRLKYVTRLPAYSSLYDESDGAPEPLIRPSPGKAPEIFDLVDTVARLREDRINSLISSCVLQTKGDQKKTASKPDDAPANEPEIPKKRPAAKKKPAARSKPKKQEPPKPQKITVAVSAGAEFRNKAAMLMSAMLDMTPVQAAVKLNSQPVKVSFDNFMEALYFARLLSSTGVTAEFLE